MGLPVAISLFADRRDTRAAMCADATLAGLRIAQDEGLAGLEGGPEDRRVLALGDIIAVDAPASDAPTLAMLGRLAERVARSGARLIVSTTIGALESVMIAAQAADPVLMVEPGRAERLVAFGEALADMIDGRVREMCEEDRLTVMRLVERVTSLAEKLDGLVGDDVPRDGSSAFAFGTGEQGMGALREHKQGERRPGGGGAPGLPDPRRVRATIRKRQLRARFLESSLFADPAWDILLDLTAARAEGRRVSVTSLCIASGVPPTTALRWIALMTDQGLLRREQDVADRRRAYIGLTDEAVEAMARYFDATGSCDCAGI
ncbi:MarR family transcriptional regulator [Alteriqipengyuania lutimaris]|uniref:MarR family transcriptional regulator n=1 Tax=Alteriqipengyuania lutimaris TaxID=1538146 RepID=A0A395LNH5_9SPHN|nr:MarR family transcriptional regulator [Alteriqipengyuania lutimaris]